MARRSKKMNIRINNLQCWTTITEDHRRFSPVSPVGPNLRPVDFVDFIVRGPALHSPHHSGGTPIRSESTKVRSTAWSPENSKDEHTEITKISEVVWSRLHKCDKIIMNYDQNSLLGCSYWCQENPLDKSFFGVFFSRCSVKPVVSGFEPLKLWAVWAWAWPAWRACDRFRVLAEHAAEKWSQNLSLIIFEFNRSFNFFWLGSLKPSTFIQPLSIFAFWVRSCVLPECTKGLGFVVSWETKNISTSVLFSISCLSRCFLLGFINFINDSLISWVATGTGVEAWVARPSRPNIRPRSWHRRTPEKKTAKNRKVRTMVKGGGRGWNFVWHCVTCRRHCESTRRRRMPRWIGVAAPKVRRCGNELESGAMLSSLDLHVLERKVTRISFNNLLYNDLISLTIVYVRVEGKFVEKLS